MHAAGGGEAAEVRAVQRIGEGMSPFGATKELDSFPYPQFALRDPRRERGAVRLLHGRDPEARGPPHCPAAQNRAT